MISFDEFIKKYNGKQIEVAGSANAKFQCVDAVNLFIRDVLGLPIIEWTDAKDFPSKAGNKYDFIENTPLGIPQKGDLIVWNNKVGCGHGHIAIFIEGDVNSFASFDQNWSILHFCAIEGHTYEYVSGWLRSKEGFINNELQECLKAHTHLMNEIKEKNSTISRQEKTLLKTEGDLKKVDTLRKKWHDLCKQSQRNLDSCKIDRATFEGKITKMKESSLLTASRKTLWLELIKDYLGKREVVVKDNEPSK